MRQGPIIAGVNVLNDITKVCSKCMKEKILHMDFYMCQGKYRSECKSCTIKKNVAYQRRVGNWKERFIDLEERREYMKKYYAANKERFALYRASFKKKNPEYHKLYARSKKNEKQ